MDKQAQEAKWTIPAANHMFIAFINHMVGLSWIMGTGTWEEWWRWSWAQVYYLQSVQWWGPIICSCFYNDLASLELIRIQDICWWSERMLSSLCNRCTHTLRVVYHFTAMLQFNNESGNDHLQQILVFLRINWIIIPDHQRNLRNCFAPLHTGRARPWVFCSECLTSPRRKTRRWWNTLQSPLLVKSSSPLNDNCICNCSWNTNSIGSLSIYHQIP